MNPAETTPRLRPLAVLACFALSVLLFCLSVSKAQAEEFAITAFDGQATANPSGDAYTQAGGHPYEISTSFDISTGLSAQGWEAPVEPIRDTTVNLPAGLIGNPTVVAKCTEAQLWALACPSDSQIGVARVTITTGGTGGVPTQTKAASLFNMVPPPGVPAAFAFNILNLTVPHIYARLRPEADYAIAVDSRNISQLQPLKHVEIALWGTPAVTAHDGERGSRFVCFDTTGGPFECLNGDNPSTLAPKPFLTMPVDCSAGPLPTELLTRSWVQADAWKTYSFLSHLPPGYPLPPSQWGAPQGVTGCNALRFEPTLETGLEKTSADSPSGMNVDLSFPQSENPEGLATPYLKDATIALPEGMTINPSAADGLDACSDDQANPRSSQPFSCPESSKLGTVTARTPLLEESLSGGIYLGAQKSNDPQSGQMFRLFLRILDAERGIDVRLPGEVKVNPETGRIEASFENNPQLPVSTISVQLKQGPRAPLATPRSCGTKTTTAQLTSWGGQSVNLTDSFTVPCPAGTGFDPKFEAGAQNPLAGSTAAFTAKLSREDGQQSLSGLEMKLPKGLSAYLKGVPHCPDASLAAASGRSGREEQQSPSCPGASRVGSVQVGAGAGAPFHVTGRAYLAGPYKGAPLSLAVITPAVAGPFDLGTVLVRAALEVDPQTAEITAVSDPLPQILEGVPLRLRSVEVDVDKPQFTLNPTSCDPMAVDSTITGSGGASAHPSSRFQVGACNALAFKPDLKLRVFGPTHRSAHPRFKAVLTMPKANGANIQKAQVTLPRTEFLENAHIRTICTRVQYAAKACPAASVYGYAKAWTPLLDQPLQGPVYLRSSSHKLPDLVASLDGQIHVDLVGRIDAVNARIRNTFETVPDAPVSRFVLEMQGGKKGLLVNNTELCRTTPRASVKFDAQNGKVADSNPVMRADCGKGRKGSRHKR